MGAASNQCDVAIVGAGPAGAAAAARLAGRGGRVLLFDHTHPREKPCGGGVTGRALDLLTGTIDRNRLGAVTVRQVIFDDPRTAPAPVPLDDGDDGPLLTVVDRRSFDGELLRAASAAGATHVAERVVAVEIGAHAVLVHTDRGRYRSDWVIGADGANSLVRRRVAAPFSRDQLSVGLGAFAHGTTATHIVIRFVASPPGYIWSFPRSDHLAVGICAPASSISAGHLRRVLDAWMAQSRHAPSARLERYAWPIPSLGATDLQRERPAGRGWMLAGDAAGLVDPITREGIFFALQSGLFAADALAANADPSACYLERLRDTIYAELACAARLKAGFFRGPFTRLLVDALNRSGAIRGVMADLVAGCQPYASLKRRLLGTFEVGLAWRLLMLELRRG